MTLSQNSQFFLPTTKGRIAFSARLLEMGTSPYHDMLYPYVLQQVQAFAKSMKRRKVNSKISEFVSIQELTQEVLEAVVERIEIGHVTYRSKPGNVIRIYWKLS